VLWKELHIEPGLKLNWLGRIVMLVIVVISIMPALTFIGPSGVWQQTNEYVRMIGAIVACFILLGVGIRAAGSITSERERQTLDGLLVTPQQNEAILFGKWLGSILGVRWGWVWLGAIWTFGLVTCGLHPLALLCLIVAWFVYAAVLAGIGLCFSANNRQSLRAIVGTIGTTPFLAFGHWLAWLLLLAMVESPWSPRNSPLLNRLLDKVAQFQLAALTPPATLAILGFPWRSDEFSPDEIDLIIFSLIGLAIWSGVAACLWYWATVRFRVKTGRDQSNAPAVVSHLPNREAGDTKPAPPPVSPATADNRTASAPWEAATSGSIPSGPRS
jgi:ABC-type transport system involved in multi-copper enzyme maturation permease subunit